jgi:hypothetical protein
MAGLSRRPVDEIGSLSELAADPIHVMRYHCADVRRLGVKRAAGQRPAPTSSCIVWIALQIEQAKSIHSLPSVPGGSDQTAVLCRWAFVPGMVDEAPLGHLEGLQCAAEI